MIYEFLYSMDCVVGRIGSGKWQPFFNERKESHYSIGMVFGLFYMWICLSFIAIPMDILRFKINK